MFSCQLISMSFMISTGFVRFLDIQISCVFSKFIIIFQVEVYSCMVS